MTRRSQRRSSLPGRQRVQRRTRRPQLRDGASRDPLPTGNRPPPAPHLPASRAVAVAFILEVGDTLDHPLIDLGEGEPLLGGALDGLGDEVRVGQVAPGVTAR